MILADKNRGGGVTVSAKKRVEGVIISDKNRGGGVIASPRNRRKGVIISPGLGEEE